jgi:hypothetical protein
MGDELLYPPSRAKKDTPPVDAVRGFVFTSGLSWMRERGLTERYRELLPAQHRGRMMGITAAEWLPLADALVAYAACDAMNLSFDEQIDLGRAVSAANNGIVVTTILRLVGRVASPWTALGHVDRVWQRSNRGGAVAVYKLGPRQARLEFWQCPLARSPFFLTSMRGAIAAGIEPFCERLVVAESPEHTTPDQFALRVLW